MMDKAVMFEPLPLEPVPWEPQNGKVRPTPLVPVPDGAPSATFGHSRYGHPSRTWAYRDAASALLGFVARFDRADGSKLILPRTYCYLGDGRFDWRFRAWDPPRPLYGLDRLAAHPDAPVLVVEGEKAADAAADLLPGMVVVTSPGGCNAAAKADWSPLVGRTPTIWPDADEAGDLYAAHVAQLVVAEGEPDVRIVDQLEELPRGWDLADPLPNGWTAETVRELILRANPFDAKTQDSTSGVAYPFKLTDTGVYYAEDDDEWAPVCSKLEVEALTRDAGGEEWGRLLAITDADGKVHRWAMPMALLAGDGAAYRERLLSLGLHIEPGPKVRNRLHSYISTTRPAARARCVSRVGWHSTGMSEVFVLPDRTYGAQDDPVLLQTATSIEHALHSSGSLADWQEHLAKLCVGNSRLVFAVSCAFAAPLLYLLKEESGGFHLRGPSSIGKSTALRMSGSVWGGGGVGGFLRNWRATANGLEGLAELHCDLLLCLDEMGQVHGREAGEVAYMLANGSGKARASRDGRARRAAGWRIMFLSTGEISLSDKMQEVGQRARAGQETRLVDIVADAGCGLGLFENLHGFASADAFARHLSDASARYYGVAGREYLTRLTGELEGLPAVLMAGRRRWVLRYCPSGADGQVQRVADRFGLVAAAGELASTMGILPWGDLEATEAAGRCFEAWLETRGGIGAGEITAGLAQVRRFFALHGESRFSLMKESGDRPTINRAGFRRDDSAGPVEFFVLPEVWRTEICSGFDPAAIAATLIKGAVLIPDKSDGKAQSRHRLPGLGTCRVYHLTAGVLGEEGDDA